jgi:hypothetical protein
VSALGTFCSIAPTGLTAVTSRCSSSPASGPLFRASINGNGGPLSYDTAHHRWTNYCAAAEVEIVTYQLRHAHAHELINNPGYPSKPSASATRPPKPPRSTPARRQDRRRRGPRRTRRSPTKNSKTDTWSRAVLGTDPVNEKRPGRCRPGRSLRSMR